MWNQSQQSRVRKRDPFGLAGGTGGVNDIGRVRGICFDLRTCGFEGVGHRLKFNFSPKPVRHFQMMRVGNDDWQLSVPDHESEAFLRKFRTERDVCRPGFENSQSSSHHFHGTRGKESDQLTSPDAAPCELLGEMIRPAIKFAVSPTARSLD